MAPPLVSVVVPTYREAENIPSLAAGIDSALRGFCFSGGDGDGNGDGDDATVSSRYELIIADDDSGDGIADVCAELSRRFPLRLLSRKSERGLSQAVLAGAGIARGEVVVVMDADLSHPPEKIAELARPLLSGDADFAVGTRYAEGGGADKRWPLRRRMYSAVATAPAKFLIPLSDPMSGFFAFRRAQLPAAAELSPIGYKIGLELAVKMRPEKITEVPIFFRERERGESKLNWREKINYLRHLRRLFWHRWPRRMEVFQFCAVGGMGMTIDLAGYYFLRELGSPHLLARAAAFWPAASFNWFLNRVMTFKTRPRDSRLPQWLKFCATSGIGFVCNWGTYALLTSAVPFFAEHLLLAFFAGVLVGTVFNFVGSDRIVFRE